VIRRAGPNGKRAKKMMEDCVKRNNLNMKIFGDEVPMGDTAEILAEMIKK